MSLPPNFHNVQVSRLSAGRGFILFFIGGLLTALTVYIVRELHVPPSPNAQIIINSLDDDPHWKLKSDISPVLEHPSGVTVKCAGKGLTVIVDDYYVEFNIRDRCYIYDHLVLTTKRLRNIKAQTGQEIIEKKLQELSD